MDREIFRYLSLLGLLGLLGFVPGYERLALLSSLSLIGLFANPDLPRRKKK